MRCAWPPGGACTGTDAKDFPGNGLVFTDTALRAAARAVKKRGLTSALRSVRNKTFTGIGSGSGEYGAAPQSLIPSSVEKAWPVRLFVKVEECGEWWMEIPAYTKDASPETVNLALSNVSKPQRVEAYGAKRNQIHEQYKRYVNPKYVPDDYEVIAPRHGPQASIGLAQSVLPVQRRAGAPAARPAAAEPPASAPTAGTSLAAVTYASPLAQAPPTAHAPVSAPASAPASATTNRRFQFKKHLLPLARVIKAHHPEAMESLSLNAKQLKAISEALGFGADGGHKIKAALKTLEKKGGVELVIIDGATG